jgi:predicted DNA-binding transcriptional regulator AlpA
VREPSPQLKRVSLGSGRLVGAEWGALAEALPPGSAIPVPLEWLLELLDGAGPAGGGAADATDCLLDVDEAAARLHMSPEWLYRHARTLPFTVRLGRKALRFSDAGITRYLQRRTV